MLILRLRGNDVNITYNVTLPPGEGLGCRKTLGFATEKAGDSHPGPDRRGHRAVHPARRARGLRGETWRRQLQDPDDSWPETAGPRSLPTSLAAFSYQSSNKLFRKTSLSLANGDDTRLAPHTSVTCRLCFCSFLREHREHGAVQRPLGTWHKAWCTAVAGQRQEHRSRFINHFPLTMQGASSEKEYNRSRLSDIKII